MFTRCFLGLLLELCSIGASADFLLLSETNKLRGISLTSGSADVITAIRGLSRAIAVDYLAETEQLLWSDVIHKTISTINKNGTNQRVLLKGLASPDGLAVDWIGQNVYFTDTGLDVIGAVGVDGSFPRILIDSALDEPRAIAVDPAAGYMYWTDWGATAKIERSYMSGRSRTTIISGNLRWPNGLCLDIAGKRMYWIDGSYYKIESSGLDGSGRKVISYIRRGYHPFGITLDGSYLFWTARSRRAVYKTSLNGGNSVSFATLTGTPFGITVYRDSFKGGMNGCSGRKCDQLCLPEPSMSFVCACSYGELQSDHRTCKSSDSFLLVSDFDSVRGLAIDTLENAIKSHTGFARAVAVDYDPLTDDIYYTDVSVGSIERILFQTGARTTVVGSLSVPDGVAVDWISRNLFYTDAGLDRIGMARLDGTGHVVVIASGLDQPRAIALALEEGLMFWTDWGTTPKIEKAWMDGTNRRMIVSGSLGWPNGIALDTTTQTLYWVDARLDKVEKCHFDGSGRTVLSQPSDPIHPYGLALYDGYLYWTDWIAKNVVRMPIDGGSNHSVYALPFPRLKQPSGLVVHNSTARRMEQNACSVSNGNCLQFCVAVPGGRRCACSASKSDACKPVIVSGPTSTTVYQLRAVTLNCVIGGVATTGIAISSFGWKKNGITMRTQYGSSSADIRTSWTIPTATKSDGGLYSCWATNRYGTRTSSSALLIVEVDCQVNSWGNWGACGGTCHDTTIRLRYRSVRRSGANCPSTSQSQRCYIDSKACLIGRVCYAHLQRQSSTGNGGCQECNKLVSRSAWTAVSGGPCDDTQACTKDDQCKNGVCSGTSFTCKSCETCNGVGCTLIAGYCLINSQCYSRDTKNPESQYSQCQACKPDQSTIQWTPLTGDSCNDNDLCTHTDKCMSAGLCVGTQIPGQCSLPCQECDGTSTCKIIKGCLTSSSTCGCLVGGTCYDNNAVNPGNQCQYCNFGASGSSWTDYAKGTNCDDGQRCTRNDHCDAASCVSEDFTAECAVHTVITNPCVSGTYCNGSNCLPIYYPSSRQCYANVDECDYPDLNCEGDKAACSYCTGGSCVAVNPTNTPKGTTGVDLSTAQISVFKSGTQTLLSLKQAPDGVNYLMITDNKAIKIKFQNFKVPCGSVTIDWRLVTAVGETNVLPQQTVTTTSAGTVDVTVTNQFTLTNGAKYKIKVTAKNVRNTPSTLESSLILVDITNPVIGVIYDGDRPQPNQQADITYQMSNTRISAHWNPNTVYDRESGLKTTNRYQIAVGTSALSTNTKGYVTVQADSGEIALSLQHNTVYYVTLRVYNRAGLVSTRSSNGVKVDTTNPVTGTLTIVKSTSDRAQLDYVNSPTRQLVAKLKGCNDPESGIIEIRWTVCAENVNNPLDTSCSTAGYQVYSSCSDLSDCVINITLSQNDRILYDGNFESGYSYDLRLIIKNGALRTSSVTSNKFITDYSLPNPGTVLDSLSSDIDYQHVNTSVSVNWSGFKDDQSDLDYCQLAVYEEYNTADEKVVSSFSNVPFSGSKTVTNLIGVLITGKTYKPVVRCYNKAGLFTDVASDGVFVDAFPPVPTEILDIRFEDNLADESIDRDYQVLLSGIKTKWVMFPSVSGLQSCGWSLKTDLTEVVSEMPTNSSISTTFSHAVNLVLYNTYYAFIRCTSRAGLSSTGTSDGIAPANTHPLAGVVFDLCQDPCGLTTDIDYSPNDGKLRFRWEGFSDPHSGIDYYEWNYDEDCSGFYLLSDFKNVGVTYEVLELLPLNHDTRYCVTVRGVNGAGLKVVSVSDGVLIDTTRPKAVVVKDGDNPSADLDSQLSDSVISFTWPLIQDPESYIAILEVGYGSAPGDNDAVNLTMVANTTTSHTFGGLSLVQNQVYYAKVCAMNGARLRTCVHSNGVLIEIYQYRPTCNCTSVALFCAVLVDVQSVGSNAMLVKPVNEANATCLNRNLWENGGSLVNFGGNSWNDNFCEVSSKSFAVQQGFTKMDLSELPCLLHSSSPTSPLDVNFVEHLYKKPNGRLGVRTTDLSTVNETIDSLRSAPCDCEQEVLFRWLQGHIEANMSRCTWKGNELLLSLTINGDKCGLVRAPTHGRVSCSSPASGQQETCTVQCDHGFGLRSSSVQICDPVAGWSFNATAKPTGNHLRCVPII